MPQLKFVYPPLTLLLVLNHKAPPAPTHQPGSPPFPPTGWAGGKVCWFQASSHKLHSNSIWVHVIVYAFQILYFQPTAALFDSKEEAHDLRIRQSCSGHRYCYEYQGFGLKCWLMTYFCGMERHCYRYHLNWCSKSPPWNYGFSHVGLEFSAPWTAHPPKLQVVVSYNIQDNLCSVTN